MLASIPIAHQTGHAQIFVQPARILILASRKLWIVQTSNVYLHILDHDGIDRKRETLHHTKHFLYIGFDRGRQSPTPFAGCTVEKPSGPIPAACSPALAPITSLVHLLFHILAVIDLCCKQGRSVAHTGDPSDATPFIDPTGHILGVSLALPGELNRKWSVGYDLRFPCS
jgi:hypothetical protein